MRVVQAAPEFNAVPYSGSDRLEEMILWVRVNVELEATFVDIGYDEASRGFATKYDDEVMAMAGYPREKVRFRASDWRLGGETKAWAP